MMGEEEQLWVLLTDAAVSVLPFVCLPFLGGGIISTWFCGRIMNRAWGMAERATFIPCVVVFSLFWLIGGSTAVAVVQLRHVLEEGQAYISAASVVAADSLPSSVDELTWQDLRRCQDGALKTTDALILSLTEDCLRGESTFAQLRPHRRDIPAWEGTELQDVRLQLEAFLADPRAVVQNRHDFYRKLTAICYATRMRCAARVCAELPHWQTKLLKFFEIGLLLLSLGTAHVAYRAIRVI